MSNIYHTEPATYGKVLLHTSFGDIDVELWSKECPKACRNFVQLAMEGYYDNTVFHRVIRKFMVQGGDPTGKGNGGESIYGKPFRDEIHTRIKFNHRGQVAMANENAPGTNHSQFFFTLDNAPHLDKKHTIFGKITGNTIFNALRVGDVDTDKDDRPLEPVRLTSVEVLLNPFDDIVPRDLAGRAASASQAKSEKAEDEKKRRRKKQAKKDFKLLSFGEEADQEEKELNAVPAGRGVTSAHDALDDDKFSKDAAYNVEDVRKADGRVAKDEELRQAVMTAAKGTAKETIAEKEGKSRPAGAVAPSEEVDDGDAFIKKMRQQMMAKRSKLEKSSRPPGENGGSRGNEEIVDYEAAEEEAEAAGRVGQGPRDAGAVGGTGWRAGEADDESEKEKAKRKAIKERAKEYEALREELKSKHRAARVMTGEERTNYDAEQLHREMLSPVEQMRAKYKKRRKEAGAREDSTMAKLAKFTSSLRTTKKRVEDEDKGEDEGKAYSGQVTEGNLYEGDDDADDGDDWFAGPLKFKRHIDDDLRMGSDGRKADDYAVIDPLKQAAAARGTNGGRRSGQDGRRDDHRNGSRGDQKEGMRDEQRNGSRDSKREDRRGGARDSGREGSYRDSRRNDRTDSSRGGGRDAGRDSSRDRSRRRDDARNARGGSGRYRSRDRETAGGRQRRR